MPADMQPLPANAAKSPAAGPRLRFDRNELSGAFGDLGTDLPLLVGMVLAAGLDAASVLVVFGLAQVATGIHYRMPMPVQPLKAVAVIVIAQQLSPEVIAGGGLAIGGVMLVLALTGALEWLARVIPVAVVRGLQLGLGLQLTILAAWRYIPSLGTSGLILAAAAALIVLALLGNRRVPPAPFVIVLGMAYALVYASPPGSIADGFGLALPSMRTPSIADIATGFIVLALPQLPLSLGNSILATERLTTDLFPDRPVGVRRIGITYGLMNLVAPWLGGVPVCHGSGGLAGHYALGGRTGGSVVIYGTVFLAAGLFFSGAFAELVSTFPLPVLGVLLGVEGLALIILIRTLPRGEATGLPLALFVGGVVVVAPYGYATGLVAGGAAGWILSRRRL
ncbi:MAG: transporter [Gemmatimonadaceae bacterium]|nr:transporter [Gemmatimonadaceae bacterium]